MKKILLIEDDTVLAKILFTILSKNNFEVFVASDAMQGINLAHQKKPDLIISDLMIPAGGGLNTLKNIKLSTILKFIPVIVLTALRDDEYKKKVLDLGIEAYLEKPYEPEMLLKTIRDILGEDH